MRHRSLRLSEAGSSVLFAVVGAAVALTCAAGSERGAAPPVASAVVTPSAAAPPDDARAEPPAPSDAVVEAGTDAVAPGAALSRFHAALAGLEQKQRDRHVRIAWLGDSHTSADFWTHGARKPLQARFGKGGPGFVLVGVAAYRHELARVGIEGTWRREPSSPASSSKESDGVFGLAGQRVSAAGADARISVSLVPGSIEGDAVWTLAFRAEAADRLRLAVRGGKAVTAGPKSGAASGPGSPIRRLTLEGKGAAALDIGVTGGDPEILGLFVESSKPGLVLDTLGIAGARAATALAWDAPSWQAELAARQPSLVLLAYGTNEAAGTASVERYEKSLGELVERARAAAPEADCFIIGPPDMSAPGGKSRPRAIEHDQAARRAALRAGCGFFSAFDAMGGEGGFARWAAMKPPLAAGDGVHLRAGGYDKLGAMVAEALLAGYDAADR